MQVWPQLEKAVVANSGYHYHAYQALGCQTAPPPLIKPELFACQQQGTYYFTHQTCILQSGCVAYVYRRNNKMAEGTATSKAP